jgi:uncharacterized protein (DUF302 family)
MVLRRSSSGYAETLKRLLDAIASRGLTLFAEIDHAVAAREAGLELQPERVVAFGNPRAGTPLMQADPRIGIELPLRMLVWQDADGVQLGYTDPREFADRYGVEDLRPTLEAMSQLLAAVASDAAG